jgi:3'-5' exoribonuclease
VLAICEAADLLVHTYARLNRDWLIAGAILHDLGKIEELALSRSPSYTTRGQLVGHVAIGLEILEKHLGRFPDFPADLKTALQHLIVSHHGEVAKGALRAPMFPEAMALHYLDELDARLNQAWHLIDRTPANEVWTAYVPSLARQLYCTSERQTTNAGKNHDLST